MATCASPDSRNHTLGGHIGRGMTLDEAISATGGTAEGVKSCRSVLELATTLGVEMPITSAVRVNCTAAWLAPRSSASSTDSRHPPPPVPGHFSRCSDRRTNEGVTRYGGKCMVRFVARVSRLSYWARLSK
jgi:hypothetical protein